MQQKLVDYEAKNNSKQAELATSEIKNSDLQPTLEGEGEEVTQSIKCEDCHKVFSTRKLLQDHVNKSHKKDLKCSLCDLVFLYKSKLNRHRLVHTTETQFKCDVCGKEFNQKFNLKSHASVHTDVKPFPCSECDQSFSRKNYLTKHMEKHIETRTHKCSQCVKRFFTRQELAAHIRTHTGEKPFVCQKCSKSFSRIHHLKSSSVQRE